MLANSRLPTSAQTGIHDHLGALLERHRASPFRKPYADYNRAAFDASMARRAVAEAITSGQIKMPGGYNIFWSGQYEYMLRAQQRLMIVGQFHERTAPATLGGGSSRPSTSVSASP